MALLPQLLFMSGEYFCLDPSLSLVKEISNCRFGKLGVVWSGSKCVDIEINGKEVAKIKYKDFFRNLYLPHPKLHLHLQNLDPSQVDMSMVLDDRGMAFFSEKDDHGETDDVDEEGNNGSERGQRDEVRLNQRNRPEMQRTRFFWDREYF